MFTTPTTARPPARAGATCVCGVKHDRGNTADRKRIRAAAVARQNGRCAWCSTTVSVDCTCTGRSHDRRNPFCHLAENDRIVAGGIYGDGNIVAACSACNATRGDTDWRDWLTTVSDRQFSLRMIMAATLGEFPNAHRGSRKFPPV